ncbi:RepB family plasmid replication initiator protein [Halobacillus litoralis]|uniref:RepB family plasmid replication initiator protein n=1 Tax=Halobacillus litoralis TaxID=45668 RepID=A0A845FHV0_9BACI|nr:replication initiation protein [Halobacillus litoralis]MYL73065.1 RepB family plasmid replication initiator protein [Halobacillus litoralis]
MPNFEKDMMNNTVTKSNQLIEANYTSQLSEREQKIILYIVSKVQKDDDDFQTYTLSINQFTQMMGLKKPKYEELREVTKRMLTKVIEIKRSDSLLQTHWLSSVKYNQWQGTIDFSFHPDLKPFLLYLKKEFTSYKLINVLRLNGRYAIRIYELLKKWERVKKVEFSIHELRSMLGIHNKYKTYSNFRTRVLDPAKKELYDKTDICFEYEPLKKNGRGTSHIRFHIQKNQKNPQVLPDEVQIINRLRESPILSHTYVKDEALHEWIQMAKSVWGSEYEPSLFAVVEHVEGNKNATNPPGLLNHILEDMKKVVEEGKEIPPLSLGKHNEVIPLSMQEDYKQQGVEEAAASVDMEDIRARIKKLTSG